MLWLVTTTIVVCGHKNSSYRLSRFCSLAINLDNVNAFLSNVTFQLISYLCNVIIIKYQTHFNATC